MAKIVKIFASVGIDRSATINLDSVDVQRVGLGNCKKELSLIFLLRYL